ncbi:MAG: M24 family metallopeptidase, partial [Bdellovibrionales bacterium]|nr:M24 family metallopeptidase [Bdellovibrionales bacterium]
LKEADVEVRGQSTEILNSFLLGLKGIQILSGKAGEKPSDSKHLMILEGINQARRIKDSEEIQLIRKAAQFASLGYKHLRRIDPLGLSEVDFRMEYENVVSRAGSQGFPYETLVGSGINSSVLHASPSLKKIDQQDAVLIDGGARIHDYCVDITRMFWSSPSTQHKELYRLVLKSQEKALSLCRSEVEWHDVHREAAKVLADGLLSFGVLKGDLEEILESGAISCFFPHGVGHMVGQRVRDVGSDVTRPLRKVCGVSVRVDFPLEEGFVMTVEPGVYFSKELLEHHRSSKNFEAFVNWSEAQKWIPIGGVRIEDDVLITSGAPEILTHSIEK